MFSSIQCNLSLGTYSLVQTVWVSFLFSLHFFPPSFDLFRKLEAQKGQSDLLRVVKPDRVGMFD